MQILKLSFENINSLKGAWTIDFQAPDFRSGIFAIVGPTGSGKTTIFGCDLFGSLRTYTSDRLDYSECQRSYESGQRQLSEQLGVPNVKRPLPGYLESKEAEEF